MARAAKKKQLDNQRVLINWLVALAVLILLGGIWAWYQYLHRSTYGVFWGMIDNNLNVYGVTRRVEQGSETSSIDQKLQMSLGANNVARGLTTVTQSNETGSTIITTETIGTPQNNFARYTDITTTTGTDVSSVKNVWSKELLIGGDQQNQSIFAEGIFSSIPIALLSQSQRQAVVQYMKDNQVYTVDYSTATVVERAGKQAYEYQVVVNLEGYIGALKMIDAMMNLGQLKTVKPEAYAGAEPAKLTVVASIDGRQLLEVTYDGASRRETYSGYGAQIPVVIPETNLMRSDLETKVQQLFAPAGGV